MTSWRDRVCNSRFMTATRDHFTCKMLKIFKLNLLCLTRVTHKSLTTDKAVALEFPIELECRNVYFCGERKTKEPREKPSEQGREPTSNSTHLWHRVQDLNPGHIDGRRHPYSPNVQFFYVLFFQCWNPGSPNNKPYIQLLAFRNGWSYLCRVMRCDETFGK